MILFLFLMYFIVLVVACVCCICCYWATVVAGAAVLIVSVFVLSVSLLDAVVVVGCWSEVML